MKIAVKLLEILRSVLKLVETLIKFVQDVYGKSEKSADSADENAEAKSEVGKMKLSVDQFANRVAWEGGILPAIEYGMTYTDLEDQDSTLAKEWRELEETLEKLRPKINNIQNILDESWGTY